MMIKRILSACLLAGLLFPLTVQAQQGQGKPPRGHRPPPGKVKPATPPLPRELLLKEGDPVPLSAILAKDQFGVMVDAGKDPETGETLRRFISFVEMNPASLGLFPFCDTKSVERIDSSVRDRVQLIRKKFRKKYESYENAEDLSAILMVHSGVGSYRVLFTATESLKNGLTGYLYSDAADTLFYGKIFLYGLVGQKDTVWTGTIYPTDRKETIGGKIYPVFTVIPPPGKANGFCGPDARLPAR